MSVVRSFRALHFDVTKMSVTSRIENQEAISFAYRSGKKRTRIVIIFCYRLFLISVERNFDDVCQRSRSPREKLWSVGFYYNVFCCFLFLVCFSFALLLANNDW